MFHLWKKIFSTELKKKTVYQKKMVFVFGHLFSSQLTYRFKYLFNKNQSCRLDLPLMFSSKAAAVPVAAPMQHAMAMPVAPAGGLHYWPGAAAS